MVTSSSDIPDTKPAEWYSPEWYLLEGSDKRGPFSLEQLQEMISRGQVSSSSRVGKHFDPEDTNLLVMDLLQSKQDPTFTLLDALQAARNKKALIREKKEQHSRPKKHGTKNSTLLPSQKVLLFLVAILLVAFLTLFLKQNNAPTLETLPLDVTGPSSDEAEAPRKDESSRNAPSSTPKAIYKQPTHMPGFQKRDVPNNPSQSPDLSQNRRVYPPPQRQNKTGRNPAEEMVPAPTDNQLLENGPDPSTDLQEENFYNPSAEGEPFN